MIVPGLWACSRCGWRRTSSPSSGWPSTSSPPSSSWSAAPQPRSGRPGGPPSSALQGSFSIKHWVSFRHSQNQCFGSRLYWIRIQRLWWIWGLDPVTQILSPRQGEKLTPAYGCRTGQPGYIGCMSPIQGLWIWLQALPWILIWIRIQAEVSWQKCETFVSCQTWISFRS